MIQNTETKIYINADASLLKSENGGIFASSNLTTNLLLVAPFSRDIPIEVAFLLPNGISTTIGQRFLMILQTATEEVEVTPGVFEDWNVWSFLLVRQVTANVAPTSASELIVSFSQFTTTTDTFYTFRGSYTDLVTLETAIPIGDPGDYAEVLDENVVYESDGASWQNTNKTKTEFEDTIVTVKQVFSTSQAELAINPSVESGNSELPPTITDQIIIILADQEARIIALEFGGIRKESVNLYTDLPLTGNTSGDVRKVLDGSVNPPPYTDLINVDFIWDGTTWEGQSVLGPIQDGNFAFGYQSLTNYELTQTTATQAANNTAANIDLAGAGRTTETVKQNADDNITQDGLITDNANGIIAVNSRVDGVVDDVSDLEAFKQDKVDDNLIDPSKNVVVQLNKATTDVATKIPSISVKESDILIGGDATILNWFGATITKDIIIDGQYNITITGEGQGLAARQASVENTVPFTVPDVTPQKLIFTITLPSNNDDTISSDINNDDIIKDDNPAGYTMRYEVEADQTAVGSDELTIRVLANGEEIDSFPRIIDGEDSFSHELLIEPAMINLVTTFPATLTLDVISTATDTDLLVFGKRITSNFSFVDLTDVMFKTTYDNFTIDVTGLRVLSPTGNGIVDIAEFEWISTLNLTNKPTTDSAIQQLDLLMGTVATLTLGTDLTSAINLLNTRLITIENEMANILDGTTAVPKAIASESGVNIDDTFDSLISGVGNITSADSKRLSNFIIPRIGSFASSETQYIPILITGSQNRSSANIYATRTTGSSVAEGCVYTLSIGTQTSNLPATQTLNVINTSDNQTGLSHNLVTFDYNGQNYIGIERNILGSKDFIDLIFNGILTTTYPNPELELAYVPANLVTNVIQIQPANIAIQDLDMNSKKIVNLDDGTDPNDAVNKEQLDTKLNLTGGTLTGDLNMDDNLITNINLLISSTSNDLRLLGNVDVSLEPNTGTVNVNNSRITNVADATTDTDAMNRQLANGYIVASGSLFSPSAGTVIVDPASFGIGNYEMIFSNYTTSNSLIIRVGGLSQGRKILGFGVPLSTDNIIIGNTNSNSSSGPNGKIELLVNNSYTSASIDMLLSSTDPEADLSRNITNVSGGQRDIRVHSTYTGNLIWKLIKL